MNESECETGLLGIRLVCDSSTRVVRGGSWNDSARSARVAARTGRDPAYRNAYLGFRLVHSMEEE
jgi:formylglycine-generating enzyme required for sulfatase activity